MKCKKIHTKIDPYLNGLLDEKELELFESHLKECVSCKQLVSEVFATLKSINHKNRLQPDPFLYTRLMQKIENRKENRLFAKIQRILQPITVAAIIIVGIYLGIGLGNSYMSEDEGMANIDNQTLIADFLFNDIEYESIEIFLLNE